MRHLLLALTTLSLLAGPAHAQDVDLVALERTARTGRIGLVGGVAGPPLVVAGGAMMILGLLDGEESAPLAIGGFGVLGVGAAGALVGPPLQAGSAVRGARISGVDGKLGGWAWGLWAASMASGSLGSVLSAGGVSLETTGRITGVVGAGGYIGSLVTGAAQHRKNRAAAGASLTSSPPPRLELALLPSGQGLTLAGRF